MRELNVSETDVVNGGLHIGVAIGAIIGGVNAASNGGSVAVGIVQGGISGLTGGAAAVAFKAGRWGFGSILAAQSIYIGVADQ